MEGLLLCRRAFALFLVFVASVSAALQFGLSPLGACWSFLGVQAKRLPGSEGSEVFLLPRETSRAAGVPPACFLASPRGGCCWSPPNKTRLPRGAFLFDLSDSRKRALPSLAAFSSSPSAAALPALPPIPLPVALLVGPPCSGKGSVAQRLSDSLPIKHLSTGAALRCLLEDQDADSAREEALGTLPSALAREKLRRGEMLDSALVARVVGARLHSLASAESSSGPPPRLLLLDGFPRSAEQVDLLPQMGVVDAGTLISCVVVVVVVWSGGCLREARPHSARRWRLCVSEAVVAVVLEAGDSVLELRAASRLVDPATGQVYGRSCPPPPELHLEENAAARRADDRADVIRRRLGEYRRELPSLLSRLGQNAREKTVGELPQTTTVVSVDAERSVDQVVGDVAEALRPFLKSLD